MDLTTYTTQELRQFGVFLRQAGMHAEADEVAKEITQRLSAQFKRVAEKIHREAVEQEAARVERMQLWKCQPIFKKH